MRIGISAEGPKLDAKVGDRFGTSAYLLIVDSETMKVDAIPNPGACSPSHAGIQAVILAISQKPDVLLIPHPPNHLPKLLAGCSTTRLKRAIWERRRGRLLSGNAPCNQWHSELQALQWSNDVGLFVMHHDRK